MKSEEERTRLIACLKEMPVVQVACKKTGIDRATYYRWRNKDSDFAREADTALSEGYKLISDMAESQLITRIKEGNMTAIIFWLKSHHPAYTNRIEIATRIIATESSLTEGEQRLLKRALEMVAGEKLSPILSSPHHETEESKQNEN